MQSRRLPGLDGLRAIAVLMVVFHHLCSGGALREWPAVYSVLARGVFGVQIFFVLSGFLITWLLLTEERRLGTINIKRFYFRRSLRILPPAFCYLVVITMLTLAGIFTVSAKDLLFSAFFVRNLCPGCGGPEVSHYWSLAVEEQFYLTWPFLLLVLRGRMRLAATGAAIVLLAAWRAGGTFHFGATVEGAHSLLFGCLLAQLRHDPATSSYMSRGLLQRPSVFAASLGTVALIVFGGVLPASAAWTSMLPVAATAVIINQLVAGERTLVGRLLDAGPVEWTGRLSYSLYLWQELFCWSPVSDAYAERAWPVLVALSFACASLSYYAVEQPVLALRDRLERRWYEPRSPRVTEWSLTGGKVGGAGEIEEG